MISKIKPLLLSFPLAMLAVSPASSINIVTYNLAGATGNQASQAPASAATNITGLNITRGAGLSPSGAGSSFSSSGFESSLTPGSGSNEYVELGFTVASGFKVDLNNLQIGTQSSNTGPGTIGLFYSGDGFSTALTTFIQPASNLQSVISLTSLTNLTDTVTFRFYEVGNTDATPPGTTALAGTFRLTNNTTAGAIAFEGTVSAVPVPFGFAPDFGLVVVGAWVSRKWIVKRIQELKK